MRWARLWAGAQHAVPRYDIAGRLQWTPPMPVRSLDTDPDAERVQAALLGAASVSRRLALALSLTDTVHGLARRAIRSTLGTDDETEVRLRFVELHHGRELANAVRSRMHGPQE